MCYLQSTAEFVAIAPGASYAHIRHSVSENIPHGWPFGVEGVKTCGTSKVRHAGFLRRLLVGFLSRVPQYGRLFFAPMAQAPDVAWGDGLESNLAGHPIPNTT